MSRLLKIYLILLGTWLLFNIIDIPWTDPFRVLAGLGAFILSVYYAFKLSGKLLRRFLWRIRRKLILSYIFIGVIPVFLLTLLFLLGFFIFIGQTTSEMFNSTLESYALQTKIEAEKLLHLTNFLNRDQAVTTWYGELLEADQGWLQQANITLSAKDGDVLLHGSEPEELPGWIKQKSFSGLVLWKGMPWLAAVHHDPVKQQSLQILVPVDRPILEVIRKKIGADIKYVTFGSSPSAKKEFEKTISSSKTEPAQREWWDIPILWLSVPDQYDWATGEYATIFTKEGKEKPGSRKGYINVKEEKSGISIETTQPKGEEDIVVGAFSVGTSVSRVYAHIFSHSTTLQKIVYAVMLIVAVSFLQIELISYILGFLLARSITASVHNLFEGTERIKSGDLDYQIKVRARDQLGDLAVSFNNMTESIKNLLKVRAEKERLAESLQIARQMQQNLLPGEIPCCGNIEMATMNLPAQEVCGDYYDILQKNEHEIGIIIADVSGKGPSAALYMAELKGVILSLSRRTMMPREILVEANNILAPTLDSRNFITITYAHIDERTRMMKMSRAGHNPILHYLKTNGKVEVVQPKGIGLGLGKNGVFESALEEIECRLGTGDILLFYTDGLTEAMNDRNELYGLPRLSDILLENKDQSVEQIKTAIFDDLNQFLNEECPQDDITLVLLRIN